jgi:hypothetical protein
MRKVSRAITKPSEGNWVDVHTHYDGQATWDPVLAPSSWHGVTTILFGNCGVGFAPVRPQHRNELIDLMEAIEDIPGTALAEGLRWDWESFPEYLDALARLPRTIDVAAQLPHHPLRVYVMGERGINRAAATADDIAEMRRLTEAAIRVGAFGFTTSRTYSHKTTTGDLVPGHFAEEAELARYRPGIGRGRRRRFWHEQRFRGRSGGIRLDDPAVAGPAGHDHALGPHVCDERSARLRADRGQERRGDRPARRTDPGRGRLRLPDRGA